MAEQRIPLWLWPDGLLHAEPPPGPPLELGELAALLERAVGEGGIEPPTEWQRTQLAVIAGRLLSGELDLPAALAAVERIADVGEP
jgi:hypothetical protein